MDLQRVELRQTGPQNELTTASKKCLVSRSKVVEKKSVGVGRRFKLSINLMLFQNQLKMSTSNV